MILSIFDIHSYFILVSGIQTAEWSDNYLSSDPLIIQDPPGTIHSDYNIIDYISYGVLIVIFKMKILHHNRCGLVG